MHPVDKEGIFDIYITTLKDLSKYWQILIYNDEIALQDIYSYSLRIFIRKNNDWVISKDIRWTI